VIGSLFSSLYANMLVSLLDGRVAPGILAEASDSVGFADALAAEAPGDIDAVNAAFLDGLSAGRLVTGILCLVGGVAALLALPAPAMNHGSEAALVAA